MPVKKRKVMLILLICFSLIFTPGFSLLSHSLEKQSKEDIFKHTDFQQSTSLFFEDKFVEYVLITPARFKTNFQPLINHKSYYLNATCITVEEILSNNAFWVNGTYGDATDNSQGNPWIKNNKQIQQNHTTFNDSSAKIRNFIRFAHTNWETSYVLLGGDTEFIPCRSFYGYIPNWSAGKIVKSIQASIVSDLYYGALNGTWNDDADDRFGEEEMFSTKDEADFSAEVIIGRAPVNDEHEVTVFINKVISYETSEKPSHIQLHQSYTNPQHIPDTTRVTDMCQRWIPNEFTIHTLYEKNHLVTKKQWLDSFSQTEKLLHFHVGNGYNDGLYSWYQLSWNGQKRVKFNVLDAGSLNNSFYPLHISISCLTGDFSENECLAEELLLTRNGGPSACIANSEVGCISRDDAGKYSAEFFEEIFKHLFQNENQRLGLIMQSAKEQFSKIACSKRQYRWCFYEINLLGDPETPVFSVREDHSNNIPTVHVDDDFSPITPGYGQTTFSSIQEAIDAICPFGTISIHNGSYQEHITIDKTLTLKGINQSSVILTNKPESTLPLIQLNCYSTLISNMTIKWNQHSTLIPQTLILFPSEHNGNRIQHSIIQGPAVYGILLTNSIRNTIEHNWIKECNYGIGLFADLEGLFPTKVVITCDNVIFHNRIEQNKECGLLIQGSVHNYICQNAFINNGDNESKNNNIFNAQNCHLRLIITKLNEIHSNFWDKPQQEPYKIESFTGPITLFTLDFSRGIVFKLYKCILIINLGYPSIEYDLTPAQSSFKP